MVTAPFWLLLTSRYLAPGCKVLDLGCGTGLLLELLALQPEDYLGIDPSGKMLEELKRKFPEHETKKKAAFGMLGDVGDSFLGSFFVEPLQKLEQISKG
jgi:ubiquinone/menaquinone biosynthesis C-methylase UbiE